MEVEGRRLGPMEEFFYSPHESSVDTVTLSSLLEYTPGTLDFYGSLLSSSGSVPTLVPSSQSFHPIQQSPHNLQQQVHFSSHQNSTTQSSIPQPLVHHPTQQHPLQNPTTLPLMEPQRSIQRPPQHNSYQPLQTPLQPSVLPPVRVQSPVLQPSQPTLQYTAHIPPVPSPPEIYQSSASMQDTKRKRRRKDDHIKPEEVLKGFDWSNYQPPNPSFIVFDINGRSLSNQFDVIVYKSAASTHFSTPDNAWVCYRQNQFKVFCELKSPPACQMFVRDGASTVEIVQFYVKLYAIKSASLSSPGDEVQVGLFHVGKSRVKKEKTEIAPVPFIDGRVEFANLQFERSNTIKGNPEHFHLVVALYAKTAGAYYLLLSKISPRILVRSQHPGFYGQHKTDSPTETHSPETQLNVISNVSSNVSSTTNSEDGASPLQMETEPNWQQSGESVYYIGKVGINTSDPTEALTVHGNALITGDLYKPSDRRIKSEITSVDSQSQLEHVRNLKIYDYKVRNKDERGVLAQELQEILPNAVHHAGDVTIGDKTIPDFLVVNERVLLYETIGATQQLDKQLEIEKQNLQQVNSHVHYLAVSNALNVAAFKNKLQGLSDLFYAEEISKDEMGLAGLREEHVAFGFNLFKMGPARSILVLGYFWPWLWIPGAIYSFSSIPSRRTLGRACIFKFLFFAFLYYIMLGGLLVQLLYMVIGGLLMFVNYKRNCRRIAEQNRLPTDPPLSRRGRCTEWFYDFMNHRFLKVDLKNERKPLTA